MRPHTSGTRVRRQGRPGVALVSALALLAFAAALLAGTFASANALARAQRSARASVEAEADSRRVAAEVLGSWPAGNTSLAVQTPQDRDIEVSSSFGPMMVRTRIQRISPFLYAITADVRVGSSSHPIAHRRSRLILEHLAGADSTGGSGPPHPIARWSFTGTY